jgi:archaellum component FlaC
MLGTTPIRSYDDLYTALLNQQRKMESLDHSVQRLLEEVEHLVRKVQYLSEFAYPLEDTTERNSQDNW